MRSIPFGSAHDVIRRSRTEMAGPLSPHASIARHAALALLLGPPTAIAGTRGTPPVRLGNEVALRSRAAVRLWQGWPGRAFGGLGTLAFWRLHENLGSVESLKKSGTVTPASCFCMRQQDPQGAISGPCLASERGTGLANGRSECSRAATRNSRGTNPEHSRYSVPTSYLGTYSS
jgi:hypothetical protein